MVLDKSRAVAAQTRAYMAGLKPATRGVLRKLQAEVRAAASGVKPAFSYRIPGFTLNGRMLVWCAGWTEYVSMYPVTRAMKEAGGKALERYRFGKGTLRFALDTPLPRPLIRRIIKARVSEMASAARSD
jgi:uncharacterized protein YdhG (YjbR/CyaY superfamily)